MRLTLLALLAIVATASSAQAQLPSHRASYQPRAATVSHRTTTTTSRMSNVEATVASHGYVSGEFGDGSDGCPCGRPRQTGRNCCPSIFPDVLDNIFDPLICLVPTRAFCCPYPKVNTCNYKPSTYSACGCAHPLLNGVFACKKSCCRSSCNSCSSCTAAAPSCGRTSKGSIDTEVISPPKPESPFMDDPAETPAARGASKKVKAVPPKTASNRSGWYKTTQPTPATNVTRLNAPGEIAIGNASPISIRE